MNLLSTLPITTELMKHQQVYLISNHQPEAVKFLILTNGENMKLVEVKISDVRYDRKNRNLKVLLKTRIEQD